MKTNKNGDNSLNGRKNRNAIRILAALVTLWLALTALCAVSGCSTARGGTSILSGENAAWSGYREPLSDGVKNTLRNALYMYDTFWTPLSDISAWGTSEVTNRQFTAGHTYRGIPYGQPVHEGRYVGTTTPLSDFISAVNDPESRLYTMRGENTWYYTDHGGPIWYSPYYSNDCSGFVSAALGIKRHTTRDIGADTELFQVIGTDISLARPGDLLNTASGGHVIMVYDVLYDRKGGAVQSVVTIEQTPDIIIIRTFGKDGINGSLADLQGKIDGNKYSIVRYKYIDDVKLTDGAEAFLPHVVNVVSEPASLVVTDKAAEGKAYIDPAANSVRLEGWALSDEPLKGFEYTVDGGQPHALKASFNSELVAPALGFDYFEGVGGVNTFSGTIPADLYGGGNDGSSGASSGGSVSEGSLIEVWAITKDGDKYLTASLTAERRPINIYFSSNMESLGMTSDEDNVLRATVPWSPLRSRTVTLNGWCAASDLVRFELSTDGGLWYPVPNTFRDDVFNYTRGNYPDCRECNGFYCGVDMKALGEFSSHTVTLRAVRSDGTYFDVAVVNYSGHFNWPLLLWITIPAVIIIAGALTALLIVRRRKNKKKQ